MTAYEKFQAIRRIVSADTILDSIEQILSTDQLNELADDLAHEYDYDFDPEEDD